MVLKIAEALRRLQREEKGFTLIELVIVLAIIGILVAIGIPVYNNAMLKAAQKAHDTNLRTIDSAVQQYLMGEGDYPLDTNGAGKISLLTEKNYLKEIPDIPKQLQENTKAGEGLEVSATEYTLVVDATDGVPWAYPCGLWDDAYRKSESGVNP